jgi:hypothetical protein
VMVVALAIAIVVGRSRLRSSPAEASSQVPVTAS